MIELRFASLKETKAHEYAIRFLFGGLCTAMAALIAKYFGPSIGGLFLAFPAIFPAAVSLIARHEEERKAKEGYDGKARGRIAASIDSSGASLGCFGLAAFALTIYKWLNGRNPWLLIFIATTIWFVLAFALWEIRKHRHWLCRHKP